MCNRVDAAKDTLTAVNKNILITRAPQCRADPIQRAAIPV